MNSESSIQKAIEAKSARHDQLKYIFEELLSKREQDIIKLMADGHSGAETAKLIIGKSGEPWTEGTVKVNKSKIYLKLGLLKDSNPDIRAINLYREYLESKKIET